MSAAGLSKLIAGAILLGGIFFKRGRRENKTVNIMHFIAATNEMEVEERVAVALQHIERLRTLKEEI